MVAFETGGLPDLVISGETGSLVPIEDSGAMALEIAELLSSPESRIRMGGTGRKLAERRFSLDRQVDDHIALYQKELANDPRQSNGR